MVQLRRCPPKYSFATENDFIIGPYYVSPEFRGQRIGTTLVKKLTDDILDGCIFSYIHVNNKASLAAMKNCGYVPIGNMVKTDKGFEIRSFDKSRNNELVVMKIQKAIGCESVNV